MPTPDTDLSRALPACSEVGVDTLSPAQLVDLIGEAERAKASLAALQCRATAALHDSQQRETPTPAQRAETGRSVAGMVGLARHESPRRGNTYLGLATALVHEMPHTLAALSTGEISEFKALVLVKETALLSKQHRAEVDRRLAATMATLGTKRLGDRARAIGYELDRTSPLRRIRGAESDRRVSVRPAPDAMAWVSALLPVAQGIAVHAALKQQAATLRAAGDERSEGQVMADTLVARVTGAESADQVPVEVGLVAGQATLLEGGNEPGWVRGYGPVPAALARAIVRGADRVWLRRLYAHPTTGHLVAMDSRRRTFSGRLRAQTILSDDTCRTPWCDAPVQQVDHIEAYARGGSTSASNGQGLCRDCNLRKEVPGWSADGSTEQVTTTTPTGHRYTSRPPPLPGSAGIKVMHIGTSNVRWQPPSVA